MQTSKQTLNNVSKILIIYKIRLKIIKFLYLINKRDTQHIEVYKKQKKLYTKIKFKQHLLVYMLIKKNIASMFPQRKTLKVIKIVLKSIPLMINSH